MSIEKTLYALVYHQGCKEITLRTPQQFTFFYAVDHTEARQKANATKRRLVGPIWEEELRSYSRGFTMGRTFMPGRLRFHPDGTPAE